MAILNFIKSLVSEKEGIKEYRAKLADSLSDSKLTDGEKAELDALAQKHGLTTEELTKLHKIGATSAYQNITSDQRITDDERESLDVLLNHFGLGAADINFDQKSFNKYYSLALIEKGVLPEIKEGNHDINLIFKKGEVLHFGSKADLRKLKRVTTRVNYGGLTASVKIVKGLRYRVGSIGVNSVSQEILATDDTGIFYITNQRVGYIGVRKHFSIPVAKIGSFELRAEGMYIFKDGKEAPYILTLPDYEVPLSMVSFLLNKDE